MSEQEHQSTASATKQSTRTSFECATGDGSHLSFYFCAGAIVVGMNRVTKKGKRRSLMVQLDTPEDIAEFERAAMDAAAYARKEIEE